MNQKGFKIKLYGIKVKCSVQGKRQGYIHISTLSKIERNERSTTTLMLDIISTELSIELETVELEILKDSIHSEFNDLKFLKKNLTKIISEL